MSKVSASKIKVLAPVPHPTTNFAPVWLAAALGYAEEEGLDYEIELVGTPKNAAEGVISGHGDTTFINVVFTLLARDRGVSLRPYYSFVRSQNRAFSVPVDSPVQSLRDLRTKVVGLHYDDPELFEFACAALIGEGVDPSTEVTFETLPGTPLDAPRMAAAIRDGEVQAVWQLDVLSGFMEAEGVPLRLLPCALIDPLTPSSCFNALDETLKSRPEAFGAFGRAIAKATLFALTNPEETISIMWKAYPDSAPRSGEDENQAFRRELAALKVRLAGQVIERATIPQWGAITPAEMASWQDFLLKTGAIRQRREPSAYFSSDLVEDFNAFNAEPVRAQALSYRH